MCYGCWERSGRLIIDTPAVREAAALVARVYEHSCVGGNLHVIVDDWNLEDDAFDEEAAAFIEENIHELPPEALDVERACFATLKALSETERYAALAIVHGYFPRDPYTIELR